jgi:HD-GYP domain-containing protein (c-di-GMP phosphodiesterase class II)
MLLLTAVLMWNSWQSARRALIHAANQNFLDIGALINEKSRRILSPAEATLRQLGFDPIAKARNSAQRFERVMVLADLLQSNPLLGAIYIGYPNGEFFMLRRLDTPALRQVFEAPEDARWLVQSMRQASAKNLQGRWDYLDTDLHALNTPHQNDYQFDPRTRAWYRRAEASDYPVFTAPYVFYTSGQVGVTLSMRSRVGEAVLGLDVDLSSLQQEMAALRYTPHTQIAVVDDQQRVIATPNAQKIFLRQGDDVQLRTLQDLGLGALAQLDASNYTEQSISYAADDESWHGLRMPLDALPGQGLNILIGIPDSDLLGQLREDLKHQAYKGIVIALLLLPLGWLAGHSIGRAVQKLSAQGRGLTRFRFETPPAARASYLREVQELDGVLQQMGRTVQNFLGITETISREPHTGDMLSKVLNRLLETTQCELGAVYLSQADSDKLRRAAVASQHGVNVADSLVFPVAIPVAEGLAWTQHPGSLMHLPDGTHARLALRLSDHNRQLLGLVVLQFKDEELHASQDFLSFVEKLSGALEVSIETRNLIEAQRRLLEGVIQLLADAIDAKSPYTGGHCERVPVLAEMFVDRLNNDPSSPYAGRWNAEQRYEFKLGAWLHDCGKITSPEYIIDKATKLETLYNRIHEVRLRFEVLHRDAWIDYWQGVAEGTSAQALRQHLDARLTALQDDFAFVARCNIGSESTSEADLARLNQISQQTWQRHFDDRLGLSLGEMERLRDTPARPLPATEQVLADRPEHILPWGSRKPPVEKDDPLNFWGFDMKLPAHERHLGELHNLHVRRGTLTEEDRFKVNEHIVQTLIMLRSLPWPEELARVPEIAATHHEQLNGQGYPRRLQAEQLTVEDRIMAIADIFEALTAADRPYKTPKPLSESLTIMARMARDRHICPDMFRYFLRAGLWREFAEVHIQASQIDIVDVAALEAAIDAQN